MANLERVMPRGLTAVLERATWTPQPVLGTIMPRRPVAQGPLLPEGPVA